MELYSNWTEIITIGFILVKSVIELLKKNKKNKQDA